MTTGRNQEATPGIFFNLNVHLVLEYPPCLARRQKTAALVNIVFSGALVQGPTWLTTGRSSSEFETCNIFATCYSVAKGRD